MTNKHVNSQFVYYKQPIIGKRKGFAITGPTFTLCVGTFTSPGMLDIEGTCGAYSERHKQNGVNETRSIAEGSR